MCWYRDVVEYTTPIIKALNGLPVYCRYHSKHGLALGKGLKIGRYQDFTKKRNQVADVLQACCRRVSIRVRYQDFTKKRNQTQKRKEETRKENEQATMFTACKSPCLLHASHYLYYMQVTIFTTFNATRNAKRRRSAGNMRRMTLLTL